MRTIVSGMLVVLLAGCATYKPTPKAEWRQMPDGAWIGPATTYQVGSEPGHLTCNDPRYEWACSLDGYRRSIEDAGRSIDSMNSYRRR